MVWEGLDLNINQQRGKKMFNNLQISFPGGCSGGPRAPTLIENIDLSNNTADNQDSMFFEVCIQECIVNYIIQSTRSDKFFKIPANVLNLGSECCLKQSVSFHLSSKVFLSHLKNFNNMISFLLKSTNNCFTWGRTLGR